MSDLQEIRTSERSKCEPPVCTGGQKVLYRDNPPGYLKVPETFRQHAVSQIGKYVPVITGRFLITVSPAIKN